MTKLINGLDDLLDGYDAFIVDQWGVMHNGAQAYSGAAAALERACAAGKQVVVLTNSGRRAQFNEQRIQAMGFTPEKYAGMVSSGEVAWRALSADALPTGKGKRHYVIGWGEKSTARWCEGLNPELMTSDFGQADVVVMLALPGEEAVIGERELIDAMRDRDMPLVCGNPDIKGVGPHGVHATPGHFAQEYQSAGGTVYSYGKPYKDVFEYALELLGKPHPGKVVMVGDNLSTDILGASQVGMATLLLRQGVHVDAFTKTGAGSLADAEVQAALGELIASHSVPAPTYCAWRM